MARTLPPQISTADPGSYARYAVSVRQPRIIQQLAESNPLDQSARCALNGLELEIRTGTVSSPFGVEQFSADSLETAEKRTWDRQIAEQEGRAWLDIPWYFAESFLYLKLLVAVGYFAPGDESRRDPFLPQKERELLDPDEGLAMARHVLASAADAGSQGGACLRSAERPLGKQARSQHFRDRSIATKGRSSPGRRSAPRRSYG